MARKNHKIATTVGSNPLDSHDFCVLFPKDSQEGHSQNVLEEIQRDCSPNASRESENLPPRILPSAWKTAPESKNCSFAIGSSSRNVKNSASRSLRPLLFATRVSYHFRGSRERSRSQIAKPLHSSTWIWSFVPQNNRILLILISPLPSSTLHYINMLYKCLPFSFASPSLEFNST